MELKENTKGIFTLDLGHQRCGTSWLDKYTCQSDKFSESFENSFSQLIDYWIIIVKIFIGIGIILLHL